jgi:2-polyprenyl-3-methyl-5-hydroxy-6-metoxy-1,4-benzoquinol methylase
MSDCIVCGNDQAKDFHSGLLRCGECSYVFADTRMSVEEFGSLYGRSYFFGAEYSDYLGDREVLQRNFALRLQVLKRFIDPSRHRNLLEIGCAYGFFLDVARLHFDTVRGIDIAEDGVRYSQQTLGLDAIHGDFLDADLSTKAPDVVCMWDTIEHLPRPDLYLDKVSRLTEKGALLTITTGDIGSLNARIKKGNWRLIHPPTHAHYFSKRTIAQLLHNHGFEVVYNQYCGFYRSIDNMAYNILTLRNGRPELYRLLCKTGLASLHLYLNLYDIMYVIARKAQ